MAVVVAKIGRQISGEKSTVMYVGDQDGVPKIKIDGQKCTTSLQELEVVESFLSRERNFGSIICWDGDVETVVKIRICRASTVFRNI